MPLLLFISCNKSVFKYRNSSSHWRIYTGVLLCYKEAFELIISIIVIIITTVTTGGMGSGHAQGQDGTVRTQGEVGIGNHSLHHLHANLALHFAAFGRIPSAFCILTREGKGKGRERIGPQMERFGRG